MLRHRTIGVCMRCGSKSFTSSAESIAEDAVHRKYKCCGEPRFGAYPRTRTVPSHCR